MKPAEKNTDCAQPPAGAGEASTDPPPPCFTELLELHGASIERRLGYFRDEPFVIFGYCPGGGEVIWKDGHSSGFAAGGWRVFLEEVAPLAQRYGASLGGLNSAGTHVLLMNRRRGAVYAALRESAEDFLARACDLSPSNRRCLCAPPEGGSCPANDCPASAAPPRIQPPPPAANRAQTPALNGSTVRPPRR